MGCCCFVCACVRGCVHVLQTAVYNETPEGRARFMVKNTKGKSQLTHDQSDQMTDQWPFWPYDWQIHWPMTILTSWHQFTDQWPFWLDDWQTHWPVTILTRWLTNSLISDHSDQMTDQWPFWPDDWPMTILIRWLISDHSDQIADQWPVWPDGWPVTVLTRQLNSVVTCLATFKVRWPTSVASCLETCRARGLT